MMSDSNKPPITLDFSQEWVGINLGSGGQTRDKPGWDGIDIIGGKKLSLESILPYEDHSVDYVFSSHFFEHIRDDLAQHLINESYRVLKHRGTIRITTPHFEKMKNALALGDESYIRENLMVERLDWDRLGYANNPANTVVHYYCNYKNGVESTDSNLPPDYIWKAMCTIPQINSNLVIENAQKMNVEEFSAWLLSECPQELIYAEELEYENSPIPGPRSLGLGHINWWTCDKFSEFFTNAGLSKAQEMQKPSDQVFNVHGTGEDRGIRGRGSLWVEGYKI
tara:strand:- start:1747 stop:2589 length:843 start_codon:yes stop_codon:yes gene_type:complete